MGRKKSRAYSHLIVELYKLKWNETDIDFREVLRRLYIEEEKSIRVLAKEFNVSTSTIHDWLKENGITRRPVKC